MNRFCFPLLFVIVSFCIQQTVYADDHYVSVAKSLNANDYDKTLSVQPIVQWLKAHLPDNYEAVWGTRITDCGEGTGSPEDRERDMPLCAEIELKVGNKSKGWLYLFVGTERRGILREHAGLYFGHVEYRETVFDIKTLSDLLKIK